MQPRGLRESTILQAISLILATPFLYAPQSSTDSHKLLIWIVLLGVLYGGSCLVLFAFWRGWNWARVWVMLVSLIGLMPFDAARRWTSFGVPERMLIAANMVLSAWLIYFLTQSEVRGWFRQKQLRVPQWFANGLAVALFVMYIFDEIARP